MIRTLIIILIALCATGCSSRYTTTPRQTIDADPRALVMVDGRTGANVSWNDLINRVGAANVSIIGELHDDALGHAVQLAIVQDATKRFGPIALSMEMLDRSEQWIVDDYLADVIDRDEFMQETASTNWRSIATAYLDGDIKKREFAEKIMRIGWPDWEHNYQPIIDAAKASSSPVIAANAPWARYSSFVDEHGYSKLNELTAKQRENLSVPRFIPAGEYRSRFWEVMSGDPDSAHMGGVDARLEAGYRRQLLYDATMADSIARANMRGQSRIIHLVGQFHSDFEGGTVEFVRSALPAAGVFTISMQREPAASLRTEDQGRADVIIYTSW